MGIYLESFVNFSKKDPRGNFRFLTVDSLKTTERLSPKNSRAITLIIRDIQYFFAVGQNEFVQELQEKIIEQENALAENIERIQQLETEHDNFQDVFTAEKGIFYKAKQCRCIFFL